MKNRRWLYLALIAVCLAAFYGYRAVARLSTDTKAPEINVGTETLQVSVQDSRAVLLQGVTATDNSDGDVTSSLVVESVRLVDSNGTVSVSYAAFDKAGNVAKAERQVQYTDYESPRFSLSVPLVFAQNSSFDVLSVIEAEDMVDGSITHRIRATSLDSNSIITLGTHDVEFRVTNSQGDTAELVLPVEVYSSGSYQAQLSLTSYLIYLNVGDSFRAEDYLGEYTLGREVTSLRGGVPSGFILRTTGEVDTQTPGVYTVAYKVSTSQAEQLYTGYSKLIVVVEG